MGNSVITYTEKSCPDSECQKKLDAMLAKEDYKRHKIAKDKAKREEKRKKEKANKKLKK